MANALASVQNVSAFRTSPFASGFMQNPGANTFYFENPLYVPILLQLFDTAGSVSKGSGISVPPYTWLNMPVSPELDVAFDCVQQDSIGVDAGSGNFVGLGAFLPMGRGGAGSFKAAIPAGRIPAPRGARYFFYDSDSPTFAKGSTLRPIPLAQTFLEQGDPSVGALYRGIDIFAPASSVSYSTRYQNIVLTGDLESSGGWGAVNPGDDRVVIVGVQITMPFVPATFVVGGFQTFPTIFANLGLCVFFDEVISGSTYFPDVFRVPGGSGAGASKAAITSMVDNLAVQWHAATPSDMYIPIPGARTLAFYNTGTNAAPMTVTTPSEVTIYYSEY